MKKSWYSFEGFAILAMIFSFIIIECGFVTCLIVTRECNDLMLGVFLAMVGSLWLFSAGLSIFLIMKNNPAAPYWLFGVLVKCVITILFMECVASTLSRTFFVGAYFGTYFRIFSQNVRELISVIFLLGSLGVILFSIWFNAFLNPSD